MLLWFCFGPALACFGRAGLFTRLADGSCGHLRQRGGSWPTWPRLAESWLGSMPCGFVGAPGVRGVMPFHAQIVSLGTCLEPGASVPHGLGVYITDLLPGLGLGAGSGWGGAHQIGVRRPCGSLADTHGHSRSATSVPGAPDAFSCYTYTPYEFSSCPPPPGPEHRPYNEFLPLWARMLPTRARM